MRYGIGVRVTDSTGGIYLERAFDKFPIRIGRSPLNDLTIQQPFVSEFHAVLDLHEGRLLLRDLGSTNGTLLRSVGRVSPDQLVDLAEHNYEFAIVSLIFSTHTVQLDDAPRSRVRPLAISNFMSPPEEEGGGREAVADADAHLGHYRAYRSAWSTLLQGVSNSLGQLPLQSRGQAIREYAKAMPALSTERDFLRLAQSVGVDLGSETGAKAQEEVVALQGLKELAAEHVKGRGAPESVEHLVHFLNKLKALLEVFFKSFIPLRDGYRQFELDMELGHKAPHQGTVEAARTPEELAAGLLDWTRGDEGEAAEIESTFANLMIHQVAMLNGVMNGVKQLLEELSPAAIETSLDDPQARKRDGLAVGPFRFKALWRLYEQRHGDLTAEDRHVFSLLFGRRFAEAYSHFQGERVAGPRHTVRQVSKEAPPR